MNISRLSLLLTMFFVLAACSVDSGIGRAPVHISSCTKTTSAPTETLYRFTLTNTSQKTVTETDVYFARGEALPNRPAAMNERQFFSYFKPMVYFAYRRALKPGEAATVEAVSNPALPAIRVSGGSRRVGCLVNAVEFAAGFPAWWGLPVRYGSSKGALPDPLVLRGSTKM